MSTTVQGGSRITDTHVVEFQSLASPESLRQRLPVSERATEIVSRGRADVSAVLSGADDRLLVITGPCSVHDPEAALHYAGRLRALADTYADDLVVVMRTYFEKPRTTIGWKGLINDPRLDGSHDIQAGLEIARTVLLDIAAIGLPAATELLEPITPQYIAELISWAAIGARTTESQIHRQLASGLSMPVGFKNGTDGNVQVAVDGALAARHAQSFLGIDGAGRAALATTTGNPDTHIVLRGGNGGPNYSVEQVAVAADLATRSGLPPLLVVDASHANSGKDHRRQARVVQDIADRIAAGEPPIAGVMMESFLVGGAQPLEVPVRRRLVYGQSVTDACLSWETTAQLLGSLASASRRRRRCRA
jgi:3-deoxy-7-phosphoheptulonate synthase